MSTPYEHGKAALHDLVAWYDTQSTDIDRNEATTRFHLIDILLTDVLSWPREEIVAEENRNDEYVDYAVGKPGVRLIVEAKREGKHFDVPVGVANIRQRITSLTDKVRNKGLKDALDQVAKYCATRSVPYAVISNGTQLVAFLGVRVDGVGPLEGAALVFPTLDSMVENFDVLWENLSRAGVEARTLHLSLTEGERPDAPPPLSAQLGARYPGNKGRNNIQADLQNLADVFLEDITRSPEVEKEFLEKTYASSGALSQYAMVSRRILETRYSLLHEDAGPPGNVQPVSTKKGINPALQEEIIASSMSRRPIVLLGDVGVGKTMFIKNLVHVEAKDLFDRSVVIYIDFGRKPAILEDTDSFVLEEMDRQLLKTYEIDIHDRRLVEKIYSESLKRFEGSAIGALREIDEIAYQKERIAYLTRLLAKDGPHLKASLDYVRSILRRQIIVFLDNIDQRPLEFQEHVFIMAESLANEWPATVFVSLRPDTFYRSRSVGTLAAYRPRVFTIAPPRTDVVLKKRIAFALEQLKGHAAIPAFSGGSIRIESDALTAYLEVLLANFEYNERLVALIDNLAAGNIRRALDFVSTFISSGHLYTSKIIEEFHTTGSYTIPLHEFLRAIVYGDYEYYEPEASPIANLFDISQPDGREHFLLALIILHIQSTGEKGASEGYVPSDKVYEFAQNAGYNVEQVAWAVSRATLAGLLERSPRLARSSDHEHLRVTSAGAYTARVLVAMFIYLDAVVIDTPILDATYRQRIVDARTITDRLARATLFRLYLDRHWRNTEASIPDPPFNWREISDRIAEEVAYIEERSRRSSG